GVRGALPRRPRRLDVDAGAQRPWRAPGNARSRAAREGAPRPHRCLIEGGSGATRARLFNAEAREGEASRPMRGPPRYVQHPTDELSPAPRARPADLHAGSRRPGSSHARRARRPPLAIQNLIRADGPTPRIRAAP